jgi:hypothetical protein
VSNWCKIHRSDKGDVMNAMQIAQARARIASTGRDVSDLSDEDIGKMVAERERHNPRPGSDNRGGGPQPSSSVALQRLRVNR